MNQVEKANSSENHVEPAASAVHRAKRGEDGRDPYLNPVPSLPHLC